MPHPERHRNERIGWLRAAVLGANDGIVSVSSLVVGVASATSDARDVMLAGVAGLAAGAMSMAAGEYVSVSSQADAEAADRKRERAELLEDPAGELEELTQIYVRRGLDAPLARQVALRMTEHDALGTHLRDELGLTDETAARPVQAAVASAAAFSVGGAIPVLAAVLSPHDRVVSGVGFATLLSLVLLGWLSARTGGASPPRAVARVCLWGVAAMAVTSAIGHLFGVDLG